MLLAAEEAQPNLDEEEGRGAPGHPAWIAAVDDVVEAHGGRALIHPDLPETRVIAFGRSSDAIAAAVRAQRRLLEPPAIAGERPVRIAVHTGELDLSPEDWHRSATIECGTRLVRAAHGGQVIVSRAAHDIGAPALGGDVTWFELGLHHFSGLREPVDIYQVSDEDLPSSFPPLNLSQGTANNLPVRSTRFIGREAELMAVSTLVTEQTLVTLTGAGGCGKTRLAIEVADQVSGSFGDGIWFVDLASATEPDFDHAVATACGAPTAGRRTARAQLVDHLRDRRTLLILDNCEHVLLPSADLACELVTTCPTIHVLATSRESLGVPDERTWRIGSLDVAGVREMRSALICESGRLFVDRARLVRPGWQPEPLEALDVGMICERLGGIPLAIELAAARVGTLPVSSIARGLDHRFRLLTGTDENQLPRQRTLEASVAWSYDLLDDVEKLVLRRLSVFAGGFTIEAAAGIVPDDAIDRFDIVDAVGWLAAKCLLHVDDSRATTRYAQLETIRHFGRARLVESGEAESVRDRHLRWIQSWCGDIGPGLESSAATQHASDLEADFPNIRAALEWADTTANGEAMATILGSIAGFWLWTGRLRFAARWLVRLDEHLQQVDPVNQVRGRMFALFIAQHFHGSWDEIERRIDEAESVARLAGDQRALVRVALARATRHDNDHGTPEPTELLEALDACERVGEPVSIGLAEIMLGLWYLRVGRDRESVAHVQRAGELAERTGSPALRFSYLDLHTATQVRLGDLRGAARTIEETLAYGRAFEGNWAVGVARAFKAELDLAAGRLDRADATLRALLETYQREEDYGNVPQIIALGSAVAIGQGRLDEAATLLDHFWALPTVLDSSPFSAELRVLRATAAWQAGEVTLAREHLETALQLSENYRAPYHQALANLRLGALDRDDGEHRRAEDHYHRALAGFVELGRRIDIADTLEELAGLDADGQRMETAARLLGAAAAVREPQGAVFRYARQAAYERDRGLVETALGDAFREHWRAGEVMGLDSAVELVQRTRGERGRPTFGWDSLTPTESQVVELAARGLSNPQIAENLLMGRETVKTHLSRAYRKLDLSNRAELAAAFTARSGERS